MEPEKLATAAVHAKYPEAHINCGLSNILFGMPSRSLVNQAFRQTCIQF